MAGNIVIIENLRIFERGGLNFGAGSKRQSLSTSEGARPLSDALNDANVLTNYLIQKSFVTTIRALARISDLVTKMEQAGAEAAVKSLIESNKSYINEVFSYRKLNQAGLIIESNEDKVFSLFHNVFELLSASPQKPKDEILSALKKYQNEYIEIIEDLVIDRSADLQSFGQGTFVKEAEEQLNQLDRENFKELVSRYVVAFNSPDSTSQLREMNELEKHQVIGGIIGEISHSVNEYRQKGMELSASPKSRDNSIKRLIERIIGKDDSLVVQGSIETERFLINIRYHIHLLQQLIILNGTLDKIHAYHQAITAMESGVEKIFRISRGAETRKLVHNIVEQARAEASSDDPYLQVTSILTDTRGNMLAGDSQRDEQTASALGEVSKIASQSKKYFENRSAVINQSIVALNKVSAKLRADHPIIASEAGQKNGPKTVEMLEDTLQVMAYVDNTLHGDPAKLLTK